MDEKNLHVYMEFQPGFRSLFWAEQKRWNCLACLVIMVKRRQERWIKCRWRGKGRKTNVIVELEKCKTLSLSSLRQSCIKVCIGEVRKFREGERFVMLKCSWFLSRLVYANLISPYFPPPSPPLPARLQKYLGQTSPAFWEGYLTSMFLWLFLATCSIQTC